jgi:GTP cyclohydrolase II
LLGFEDDMRRYHGAAAMFRDLGIQSVRLLTNNPAKVEALRAEGLDVERLPVHIEPGAHNSEYIRTKRKRMGHLP